MNSGGFCGQDLSKQIGQIKRRLRPIRPISGACQRVFLGNSFLGWRRREGGVKVVIAGRPNTGKSSLFNRMVRARKALVFDEGGITRDLLKETVSWRGRSFEIWDSGGWTARKGDLPQKIQEKILSAFKSGDAFILVADGKAGPQPEDAQVLERIRKTGKPFLLFINKADSPSKTHLLTADFRSFGAENLLAGSCERNFGVEGVVDWILQQQSEGLAGASSSATTASNQAAGPQTPPSQEKPSLKPGSCHRRLKPSPGGAQRGAPQRATALPASLAQKQAGAAGPTELFVIGKANSGKSRICNRILNESRMIVSAVAGTTLDTVRDIFSESGRTYALSDNPGSRRGRRRERERLSYVKSRSLMEEKAHIALIVIDAVEGASRLDARAARFCVQTRKPFVLIFNKWDLLQNQSEDVRAAARKTVKDIFHFCKDAPLVFMSAKTGLHKKKLFEAVRDLEEKMRRRIPALQLNRFLQEAVKQAPSPVFGTQNVKFYSIAQTRAVPPEFAVFANHPKGVSDSYKRFLLDRLKRRFQLQGVPLSLNVLKRKRK